MTLRINFPALTLLLASPAHSLFSMPALQTITGLKKMVVYVSLQQMCTGCTNRKFFNQK